jgi:hypothetical protein
MKPCWPRQLLSIILLFLAPLWVRLLLRPRSLHASGIIVPPLPCLARLYACLPVVSTDVNARTGQSADHGHVLVGRCEDSSVRCSCGRSLSPGGQELESYF